MQHRTLGKQGLQVSAIGLGCMGLTPIYGSVAEGDAIAAVHRAIELGVNFLDSSDAYAFGANEERLAKAIAGKRQGLVVATKFGQIRHKDGSMDVSGKPDYVIEACEASLKRLNVDIIDLYFLHRLDSATQIEDTVGAMARLVAQGKVRHIGLCEVGPQTLRRAAAVHPIAALQSEYSLWTRDPEQAVLPACRELGVGFIAFSPLGRGFLSGAIRKRGDLARDDRRLRMPRFQTLALAQNVARLQKLEALAARHTCTVAQLALAWVLAQGKDIAAIPGTRQTARLEENLRAAEIRLSARDLRDIDAICPAGSFSGERFGAADLARIAP